eukprot:scaffold25184_cov62-Phaeocystis_antarctica.AAC.1
MFARSPSSGAPYRAFDTYARSASFVVRAGPSCATPLGLGPLAATKGGPLLAARLRAANQLVGRLRGGGAWLFFDGHGLHACIAGQADARVLLRAPVVSAVLVGDALVIFSTADGGLSVAALRYEEGEGGALSVEAEPPRVLILDDARLERRGPCWLVEDAAAGDGGVGDGAPLLLALSSYTDRSCHVHCALLDLSGMAVRAAPVPCLVGTARPHAVAIGRGAAAPRLLVVAEVRFYYLVITPTRCPDLVI